MDSMSIWKRLIWKETRESLPIIALGIVAPALLFGAQKTGQSVLGQVMLFLMVIGIFIWASEKANLKRNRTDFEQTFMLMPFTTDWIASFLFPALIVVGIAAWLGFWMGLSSGWSHVYQSFIYGAVGLLSGFCVCNVTSRAFTLVFGIVAGLFWMIPTVALLIVSTSSQPVPGVVEKLFALAARASVGAVIGSALPLICSGHKLGGRSELIPFVVTALVCFVPYIGQLFDVQATENSTYANYCTRGGHSLDGSVVITVSSNPSIKSITLSLANYRDNTRRAINSCSTPR